jgi:hypothetical protein
MNITAPSQNFTRLAQVDKAKGVEIKAFDQSSLFHSETELTLSEAAQRLTSGETVSLEEVSKNNVKVSWTEWGHHKDGVMTITQRMRTHLNSAEELNSFVNVRSGEEPQNETEALAKRLLKLEGHVDPNKEEVDSIASVTTGFFGGKKVEDGPGLSAFEAAQCLLHHETIAITQVPVQAMAEAMIGGAGEEHIRESMKTRYLSAESDLDAFIRH